MNVIVLFSFEFASILYSFLPQTCKDKSCAFKAGKHFLAPTSAAPTVPNCSLTQSGFMYPISSLMEPRREASALQFLPAASTKSSGEEAPWELAAHCGKPFSLSYT